MAIAMEELGWVDEDGEFDLDAMLNPELEQADVPDVKP
jgi:hypothetical protein